MANIIPAILAVTEEEYRAKLRKIEESREFEWVQIDLMDNKFVQNAGIAPEIIARYPTDLKVEIHLMVENPANWMDKLKLLGISRLVAHIEVGDEEIRKFIDKVKEEGLEVGLAINPETEVDKVKLFLNEINALLVMSVHPGKSGQEFMPEVLSKIEEIKQKNPDTLVGVDGGIGVENAKLVVDAGADYLVVGSHLTDGNIEENFQILWRQLNN